MGHAVSWQESVNRPVNRSGLSTRHPRLLTARNLLGTALVLLALGSICAPSVRAAKLENTPASSPNSLFAQSSTPFAALQESPQLDSDNPAITFDELSLGTTVTDQYADQGVVFTSDVFTTEDGANPTTPVLSGNPRFEGPITAEFVTPGTTIPTTVNGFSLDVGYIDNRSSVVVDYLDSQGDVVGSQYAQSYGINHLTVTYRGIAGFTVEAVSEEPAGFGIDNLVIDPTVSTPVHTMASLGDSYSSGEGRTDGKYDCGTDLRKTAYYQDTTLPEYDPYWIDGVDCDTRTFSTHEPPDLYSRPIVTYENRCHRHDQAYPNLIARAFDIQQFLFVACSGAVTDNVGATEGNSQIKPTPQHPQSPVNVAGGNTQLTDLINFDKQRLGGHDPDVITIGVGGNDANFRPLVEHCARPWVSDCKDGTAWAEGALSNINGNVFERLVDTFTTLRDDFPDSTLLVFGYPTVVEPGATCGLKTAYMDGNETNFLGGTVLDTLNSAVADAAAQAGAYYIDISRVTQGHDVCAADPWVNGITLGYDGVDPESLHPNVAAHQAIGRYFIDHYTDGHGNLLVANPEPSAAIRPAVGPALHLATLQGTPCGLQCTQPAACVLTCQLEIQGGGYSPGAQLHLVLHSDPVELGETTADGEGRIDTTVTIPAGTEPGLHWLAVDGTAPDGSEQEGTVAVNVYATPPPPLRVHPSASPTPPAPSPPGPSIHIPKSVRRALAATLHLTRHSGTLTLKLACPSSAPSSCRIGLSLRRAQVGKRGRKITKTLLNKRVTLAAGRSIALKLRSPAIRRTPRQFVLTVETTTMLGTLVKTFHLPR